MPEWKDITSEEYRIYNFPDMQIMINQPIKVLVSSSGSHRVLDASGKSHWISAGFKHIEWKAKDGEPNFVF